MPESGTMNEGVIVRIVEGGLGYLEEEKSKQRFAFQFGKIRGYGGESAEELELHAGSRVRFRASGDTIDEVELIKPAHRRTRES
jgi:hypothetical protein